MRLYQSITSDSDLSEKQLKKIGNDILSEYQEKSPDDIEKISSDAKNSIMAPNLQYYPTSRVLKSGCLTAEKIFGIQNIGLTSVEKPLKLIIFI